MPIRVRRLHYDYSWPTFQFSPAGGTQAQQLQLDPDAYFEFVAWSFAQQPGAAAPLGATMQIVDQSTGWQFSNAPIFLNNFASVGNNGSLAPGSTTALGAQYASPLVVPFIFRPSTQLLATFVMPAPGGSGLIYYQLTLKGFKIYPIDQIEQAQAA